jgi:hypothetical protein
VTILSTMQRQRAEIAALRRRLIVSRVVYVVCLLAVVAVAVHPYIKTFFAHLALAATP